MLVLPCVVCLATQTFSLGEVSHSPVATQTGKAGRESLAVEHAHLLAATAPEPGKAEPADFEHPSSQRTSGDPPATGVGGELPSQVGSRQVVDEADPASGSSTRGDAGIKLPPRGRPNTSRDWTGAGGTGGLKSLVTVASSLAVVLGLFLVVAWAMRRAVPGASVVLPSEVMEVLGRATLAGREQVHLLRCGSKLLLVSVSQTGVEPLTEITDPDEVSRLAGLCRQSQPGSTTAAFRQVFQQLARPGTNDGASEGHDV